MPGIRESMARSVFAQMKKWTWHHLFVFLLTFLAYASFHACRKSFSNIKDNLAENFTPDDHIKYPHDTWQKETTFANKPDADVFLGELDSLFLFAYAFGLFFNGVLGDRLNLRYFLAFGMCGSAVVTFTFGYLGEAFHIRKPIFYQLLQFLNGLLQSIGWPATVSIMGNWFSKSSSGFVFGIWSANASVGNIIGSVVLAQVLNYGFEYGMMLNSLLLFCCGFIVLICLVVHPTELGLENPDIQERIETMDKDEQEEVILASDKVSIQQPKPISFIDAVLIPGVIPYSLAYACLKLVNYSFFFWLPTYLSQGLGIKDNQSVELSNFYDVGGICGGIVAGIISDFVGVRSPVVGTMLLVSVATILGFNYIPNHHGVIMAMLFLNGFMIGGPANTISTAITADLGKHEKIMGNSEALSTVTGIIDGTGSVGAAIGQYLVAVINKKAGWQYVFYFLIGMTALSLVCIIPMLVNEIKYLFNKRPNPSRGYSPLLHEDNDVQS